MGLFFCALGYRCECGNRKMDRRKHEQVVWESDDKYGMIDISSNPYLCFVIHSEDAANRRIILTGQSCVCC